jgi:hypothetical protein
VKAASSRLFAALVAAWLTLIAAPAAKATSVLPLDLDAMVGAAQHIVHVRCLGNDVRADAAVRAVTVTTFVVLDRAKGIGGPIFTVRQAGGELDGIVVDYHVPKFRAGDEYVLLLPAPSRLGLASPVGLAQGVFGVAQGPAGKDVGNGHDFAELLPHDDPAQLPPGIAARLQRDRAERLQVDLGDFMMLLRAKGRRR